MELGTWTVSISVDDDGSEMVEVEAKPAGLVGPGARMRASSMREAMNHVTSMMESNALNTWSKAKIASR